LVIVFGLRQITQALVSLLARRMPSGHYPGFPSLLVTYGVANDYFFSGILRSQSWLRRKSLALGRRWLTGLAVFVVVFESLTVLVLRAHYTMDVFTGMVTGL
jgi:hypothetical protein